MTAFQIEDLPIESQMLTNALDEAQRKVESYFFDIRKQLFEYDQVLNTQRDKVGCGAMAVMLPHCVLRALCCVRRLLSTFITSSCVDGALFMAKTFGLYPTTTITKNHPH